MSPGIIPAGTADHLSPIAQKIGESVARRMFKVRGNRSEIHLGELELALIAAVAAEAAVRHARRHL